MKFQEVTWEWATNPSTDHLTMCPLGDDNQEFRDSVLERLENVEAWPDVEGIIFFQNVTMDSSHLGESSILIYGPNCTYRADILAKIEANPCSFPLGETPSVFKYAQWYISRAAHLQTKGTN